MTTDKAHTELNEIRRILFGPIEESNDARDERILKFIKSEMAATSERLDRIEARLDELAATVDDSKQDTLNEIGRAIVEISQHPKRLMGPNTGELHDNVQALAASRNSR